MELEIDIKDVIFRNRIKLFYDLELFGFMSLGIVEPTIFVERLL